MNNRLSTRLSRLEVGSRSPVPCTVLSYPRSGDAADLARFQSQLDEAIRGGGRVIVAVAYNAPYPALPPGVETMSHDMAYRELLNDPAGRACPAAGAGSVTPEDAEALYCRLMLEETPR